MLVCRLYWQDEMLRQALDTATPPPPDATPTKSALATPGPEDVASIISALGLPRLLPRVSWGIGNACAQRLAKSPPTGEVASKAPQHGVPIPTRFTHRDPLTGQVTIDD
ncbi:hypothetical protein OIE66_06875 [Nonomuraea sp. NBC_01738]|uniref:hypothetical protein n=1 Tax=Nonomuraea sp. NBC_01738 TaxID=2976003 RepID=UPI002E0D6B72|nr:hypothetical protein OIE66_06875 [Nonomuraea sp. NBC_01738]